MNDRHPIDWTNLDTNTTACFVFSFAFTMSLLKDMEAGALGDDSLYCLGALLFAASLPYVARKSVAWFETWYGRKAPEAIALREAEAADSHGIAMALGVPTGALMAAVTRYGLVPMWRHPQASHDASHGMHGPR